MITNNMGHFVISILVIQISSVNFLFSFADNTTQCIFLNDVQNFILLYIFFLLGGSGLYVLQICYIF